MRIACLGVGIFRKELCGFMGAAVLVGIKPCRRIPKGMLASEIGPERTWANSRHSNAKFAKLCPQDIGQTDDGEFCGAIRAAPAKAHEPALA